MGLTGASKISFSELEFADPAEADRAVVAAGANGNEVADDLEMEMADLSDMMSDGEVSMREQIDLSRVMQAASSTVDGWVNLPALRALVNSSSERAEATRYARAVMSARQFGGLSADVAVTEPSGDEAGWKDDRKQRPDIQPEVNSSEDDEYVLLLPFGTHDFQNEKHVFNFLRYLFSVTQNHPTNSSTGFNMITEYEVIGDQKSKITRAYLNTDPHGLLKDYRLRSFYGIKDTEKWLDDGFYVAFIVRVEGELFSNFLELAALDDEGRLEVKIVDDELFSLLEASGGKREVQETIERARSSGRIIRRFEEANADQRRMIEENLHKGLNEAAGGEVAIAVSHNDQATHNPWYHIHRIRRRRADEKATVTQEEIAHRNQTTTRYDGDRMEGVRNRQQNG